MRLITTIAVGAIALSLATACNDEGPTTIELPIATIELGSCPPLVVPSSCRPDVVAMTADGDFIADPILRWTIANGGVARVSDDGLVTAVGAGRTTLTVSNTTGTASDNTEITVLATNPK